MADVSLTLSSNDVDKFCASSKHFYDWSLRDVDDLSVSSVGGLTGVSLVGDLSLTAGGKVTQSAPLLCWGLALSVTSDVTLNNAGNSVHVYAASVQPQPGMHYQWSLYSTGLLAWPHQMV